MGEALHRRHTVSETHPEAAAFGRLSLVVGAVVVSAAVFDAVSLYVLALGPSWLPTYPLHLLFNRPIGLVLGAVAAVRVYGLETRLRPPAPGSRLPALGIALAPVALVCATSFVGTAAFEASLSRLTGSSYSPRFEFVYFLQHAVVPALVTGVGSAVLFYGLLQERLRELVAPTHAVLLTGLFAWFAQRVPFADGLWSVRQGPHTPVLLAVAAVALVSLWVSVGVVYRSAVRRSVEGALRPAFVPVFAFGLVGLVATVGPLLDFPGAGYDLLGLSTVVAGAYGYERTGSLWTPVLALAVFEATVETVLVTEAVLRVGPV